jgi:glucose-6-phosphate isomerase
MYVEELIGPETVDTVPPSTLAAFREHGEARLGLDGVALASDEPLLAELAKLGIDMRAVTTQLEDEGVAAFSKSFESLTATLEREVGDIRAGRGPRSWYALGELGPDADQVAGGLQKSGAGQRLWSKDPTLWVDGTDPRAWMGWLNLPDRMQEAARRLALVADQARADYSDVVLLGMGGSSLCPDVLRTVFGAVAGHPRLHVLDTTDPGTVLGVRRQIDPGRTLFVAASKSGGTTETLSHLAYFWEEVRAIGTHKAERNFAVITDPGTSLEKLAAERDYRWIFLNPPDIGGRYSALSYFGMVPAALMGLDVAELLERAAEMATSCEAGVPVERNPGLRLGAVMGALSQRGRDKLTLLMSPQVATLGYWVEQLVAESTGKLGKGIVPIEGEPVGRPDAYGDDRLFVQTRMAGEAENGTARGLEAAGHPVVTLTLRDRLDIGGEFLRWELATAIAGSVMGINPFDQPNVQESKDNTRRLLASYATEHRLPAAEAVEVGGAGPAVAGLLAKARPRGYFAVMAYTARGEASEEALGRIRAHVRDATRMATTAGYGPRFLHSTGQLHKGGPPTGLFMQIVQDDAEDVQVPGEPYSFSTLKQAQSLGDLESLRSRGYPVVRVSLGAGGDAGWRALADSIVGSPPR